MSKFPVALMILCLCAPAVVAQRQKPPRPASRPASRPAPSSERARELEALAEPQDDFDPAPRDEWLPVAAGKYERYFFNPAKVSSLSPHTLKFWVKEVAKDGSIYWSADVLERRKREGVEAGADRYGALSHVMILYEVDCARSRLRLLSRTDYSRDGEVLSTVTLRDHTEWDDIVPESIGESFAKAACAPRAKK